MKTSLSNYWTNSWDDDDWSVVLVVAVVVVVLLLLHEDCNYRLDLDSVHSSVVEFGVVGPEPVAEPVAEPVVDVQVRVVRHSVWLVLLVEALVQNSNCQMAWVGPWAAEEVQ